MIWGDRMGIKPENYKKVRKHFIKLLGGRCVFCHTKEDLEFDHIVPHLTNISTMANSKRVWHWFDEYTKRNLQLLCSDCNNIKNDSSPIFFATGNSIL